MSAEVWEYLVLFERDLVESLPDLTLQGWLNEHGANGWELVSEICHNGGHRWTFKRRRER